MKEFLVDQHVEDIEVPENLKTNTLFDGFHSKCPHPECYFGFYGLSFGQSPFSTPKLIQDALISNVDKGLYAPVRGIPPLIDAIAQHNKHYFKINVNPQNIYVGPGTKELIFNLLEILHGTVILPTPTWLGYLPQLRFLNKNFHMLPTDSSRKISPHSLRKLALQLRDRQKILILNNPNNPTGLLYDVLELHEIADVCREQNIMVISDEIYAHSTFDFTKFTSMGRIYPEGTFTTNGISKSHSAGGYRLGYVIFPDNALDFKAHFEKVLAIEHTAVCTPIQHAAVAGFEINLEIDKYLQITRNINQIMGEYLFDMLTAIEGVRVIKPQGTFYLLADFNTFAAELTNANITTSQQLTESLIKHPYHTDVVGGDSFVLERTDYSARIAYVDYDGDKAYAGYIANTPQTDAEKLEFVNKYAPRLGAGAKMIERFLNDLKNNQLYGITKMTSTNQHKLE